MRREILIAIGLGALAAPVVAAFAQQQSLPRRIGFLGSISAPSYAHFLETFRAGLRDLGYVEGKNIVIEYRWAEGRFERLPELAAELVRSRVEVILTHGTPGTRAAKQATTTIPIVMAIVGDAVAAGIVGSIARPGGNVTGSSFFSPQLAAKRLELIKEAVPRITNVGVLVNPLNPAINGPVLQAMRVTAKALKVEIHEISVRGPSEFDAAFSTMSRRHADAAVVTDDGIFTGNPKAIADLAAKYRFPVVAGMVEFGEAGGLMAYGPNRLEPWRRAAAFVDKILKGAKPSELPVEQAAKFEMVINLKAAKALALAIPQELLLRADKVIE